MVKIEYTGYQLAAILEEAYGELDWMFFLANLVGTARKMNTDKQVGDTINALCTNLLVNKKLQVIDEKYSQVNSDELHKLLEILPSDV